MDLRICYCGKLFKVNIFHFDIFSLLLLFLFDLLKILGFRGGLYFVSYCVL